MLRKHALCALVLTAFALFCWPAGGSCGELAVLSAKTWDEFVPKGKEVDAIYGDFVLRNDRTAISNSIFVNVDGGRFKQTEIPWAIRCP